MASEMVHMTLSPCCTCEHDRDIMAAVDKDVIDAAIDAEMLRRLDERFNGCKPDQLLLADLAIELFMCVNLEQKRRELIRQSNAADDALVGRIQKTFRKLPFSRDSIETGIAQCLLVKHWPDFIGIAL